MKDGEFHAGSARLRLIGSFQLTGADGSPVEVPSRRARALMAYLVLGGEGCATRERLCGLLWSDRGDTQARASLRQCLLEMRTMLQPIGPALLTTTRDEVRLDLALLGSDADDLEAALADDDPRPLAECIEAIGEHRLLADLEVGGLFRDWRDQARARFDQRLAAGVLARLEQLAAKGDWTMVRRLADAFLCREPLDETVAAMAIRADAALGATASAHRRFQAIKSALASEFGASPGAPLKDALASVNRKEDPTPPVIETVERPSETPLSVGTRPRLAVLPFSHGAGDDEQAVFAEALMDDLIVGLSKAPLLSIVPSVPVPVAPGGEPTTKALCQASGADYLIRGKVRRVRDLLRVSVELISGSNGASPWSARYERNPTDLFLVLDEVTSAIVGAVEPAVLEQEEALALRSTDSEPTFWQLFIRARKLFWQATANEVREADRLLERALRLQPDDASALAIHAHCKLYDVWVGAAKSPAEAIAEAYQIAGKAVRVAPGDAFAHYTLGVVLTVMDRITEAEAEQRLALDLNPYLAVALGELGRLLAFAGRSEDAIAYCDRAIAASPNDPHAYHWFRAKAIARFIAGDCDGAARDAADAVARGPHRFFLHVLLAACYAEGGRIAEAREAYQTARRLQHENAGGAPDQKPRHPGSAGSLKRGHPFVDDAQLRRFTDALRRAAEPDPDDYPTTQIPLAETTP